MLHSDVLQPDTHAAYLIEDLRRMSLATDEMPAGYPVIPPSAAAPPVGSRAVFPMVGSTPSRTFPYGLNMVAQQYASSISASMHAYGELPRHRLCFALPTGERGLGSS
jgi:hypothetical protein